MDSEACLLIELQCVIYQWIRFDKLYKLLANFFQILISFSNYLPITEKYLNHVNIDQSEMYYISMDLTRQALQTNGKRFFLNFWKKFRISYNF